MIYNDFFKFIENKDRFIDNKLDLTNTQKSKLKDFFKLHPSYESKIDWNRKDLTWDDFTPLFELEFSKSKAKKQGIAGLKKGKDYLLLAQNDVYSIYYPLNHKASQTLASKKVYPYIEGEWCISMNNEDWWNSYITREIDFFFLFTEKTKYAISRYPAQPNGSNPLAREGKDTSIFTASDMQISSYEFQIQQQAENNKEKWITATGKDYIDVLDIIALHPYDPKDWYREINGAYYAETESGTLTLIKPAPDTKELTVVDNCIEIKINACMGSNLKKVYIPDSVQSIDSQAFKDCRNLKEIRLPDKLYRLSYGVFSGCKALKTFHISSELNVIGGECFAYTGLTEFIAPPYLEHIGPAAFSSAKEMRKLVLNEGLKSLDLYAFSHSGIEEVTLPSTLEHVPGEVFSHCPNLKKIDLSRLNADIIPRDFCKGCTALEQVIFPKKLVSISYMAFGNTGFREIHIPKGVDYLEESAFRECSKLTRVYLEYGTKFKFSTFWDCKNLKDIFYGGTKRQWEYSHTIQPGAVPGFKQIPVTVHCSDGIIIDTDIDHCKLTYEEARTATNTVTRTF